MAAGLGESVVLEDNSLSQKIKMIKNIIIGFVIVLLVGCASQKDIPTQAHYLALLPENADIYLRFPVQENKVLAEQLVAAIAPRTKEKDIQKLTERFAMIYGAVKNKEISAVASGSFPKIGLSFALKKKNGWIATKDASIPVTGKYYQYRNLPLQIAFPNSSTMMAATQVTPLLESFQRLENTPPLPAQSELFGRFQELSSSQSIDFYTADVMASLASFMSFGLSISLPVKDMYGSFIPTSTVAGDGSQLYAFDGYLGLHDFRALKPALVALRILARTMGINFSVSGQEGDTVIHVSDITISQKSLAELISKVVQ